MKKKSNILFILTDQQRYDTIAALGNSQIRTPNLDRLVKDGVAFNRAYTPSPVCVAARCSLATGLPPHRTGCTDNMPMPQNIPSFMDKLKKAGYQTHGVGKMHFTPNPHRMWGFESRDVAEEGGAEPDDFRKFVHDNGYDHIQHPNGLRSEYYYIPQPSQLPVRLHQTTWVADRSIDFLKKRDTNRPFLLWTSFIKPHPPFETPMPWNLLYRATEMDIPFRPENSGELTCYWNRIQNRYKYRDAGHDDLLLRTMRAAYYASISFIDYNIGRILKELGPEADNTLIVFTSDHGEYLGDYGCYGKRGMHEVSSRIPFIVRFPGKEMAGQSSQIPVSLLDLYPTFLAQAGLKTTKRPGSDLKKLLQAKDEDRWVTSQFSENGMALYMITNGVWKYVYSVPDRREWLWNLSEDPRELRDLSACSIYHETLSRLREKLLDTLRKDGYDSVLSQKGWKQFPQPVFPDNKDAGLLTQDYGKLQADIDALGPEYARQVSSTGPRQKIHAPFSKTT